MKHVLLYPAKMLDDRPEVHVRRYAMSDDVAYDLVVPADRGTRAIMQVNVGERPVYRGDSIIYDGVETNHGLERIVLPETQTQYLLLTRNGPLSWDPSINTQCRVVGLDNVFDEISRPAYEGILRRLGFDRVEENDMVSYANIFMR